MTPSFVLLYIYASGFSFNTGIISSKNSSKCWKLLKTLKKTNVDLINLIFNGGFPVAVLEKNKSLRNKWFKDYIRTYVDRDIKEVSQIQKTYDFKKFLSLAAFRSSQILNLADLARDSGISYSTAHHFLSVLISTYQIFLLEPFFKNIGKRLIKSPKLMWFDTAFALHLQGITNINEAIRLNRIGHLIENKIGIELKSLLSVYLPSANLFYYRTNNGAEIDFIIENNSSLIPLEVKWSETVNSKNLVSMELFLKDFKEQATFGIVLYNGENLIKIRENIFLVPFKLVL